MYKHINYIRNPFTKGRDGIKMSTKPYLIAAN